MMKKPVFLLLLVASQGMAQEYRPIRCQWDGDFLVIGKNGQTIYAEHLTLDSTWAAHHGFRKYFVEDFRDTIATLRKRLKSADGIIHAYQDSLTTERMRLLGVEFIIR